MRAYRVLINTLVTKGWILLKTNISGTRRTKKKNMEDQARIVREVEREAESDAWLDLSVSFQNVC